MARTYIRNIGGWGAMELKTNVDNSRRLDHLHMTQLSVSLNRLIPDSLTKPRRHHLRQIAVEAYVPGY
ncbi:hypothetical protein GCM10009085_46690 [Pseudomonas avellanae]|nr:hypothetical protein GCM10009085_46690 [Pseudomonas avellanae]